MTGLLRFVVRPSHERSQGSTALPKRCRKKSLDLAIRPNFSVEPPKKKQVTTPLKFNSSPQEIRVSFWLIGFFRDLFKQMVVWKEIPSW